MVIYLIDRLADSLSLGPASARSLRQEFCSRHTKLWIGLTLTVALLDATVVFSRLDHGLVLSGAFLGGAAFVYLTLNYAFSQVWKWVPLKEVAVGFLFAAGTFLVLVPQLSRAPSAMERSTIAFAAFLFASLCSLNCMSIAVWERDLDRSQGKHSIATRWPRVDVVGADFLLCPGGGCFRTRSFPIEVPSGPALCLAVSAILLAMLHSLSMDRDDRTALADLVLLTPAALILADSFWNMIL